MDENNACSKGANKKTSMGLDENLEGAFCYVLGFVSGIIFLVMEKDSKVVKFHAIQSIGVSLILVVINILISSLYGLFSWSIFWIVAALSSLISLAAVILWLILILKTLQGEKVKLPIIGNIAEKQSQM